MSATTLHGKQIRLNTISRDKIDAAFESQLVAIQNNITTITNTMSTDTERLDAIAAVTAAWQAADGSLQTAITSMVNATKAGAGLESDGSLVLPVGQNYLTGSTTLKQALGLLDAALKLEETNRIAADAALQTSINTLAAAGAASAQANLDTEIANRIAADTAITTSVTTEVAARTAADTALQTAIDNEVVARTALNTTLSTAIADEANARTAAVSAEATTRASAVTTLQSNLDAEALARTNGINTVTTALATEVTDRTAAVTAEVTARTAAVTALDGRIATLEGATSSGLTYSKYVNRETPVGVVDGTNALFTLEYTPFANSEMVFLNGQLQEPGAGNDYTISGKDITFTGAPSTGDRVKVTYFR